MKNYLEEFQRMKTNTIHEAIIKLIHDGYKTLPCNVRLSPEGKKTPFFGSEFGWSEKTSIDFLPERLRALSFKPNGLIILTGKNQLDIKRNLLVIDLDRKPGKNPDETLRQAHIALPGNTPRVKTPNGEHYYFKLPAIISGTHANLFHSGSGIDSRGNGGFVYAPPTQVKGYGDYRWIVMPDTPLVDIPQQLAEYLTNIERKKAGNSTGNKTITHLSKKQRDILFERFQQAKEEGENDPENRDRSNYDFRLLCWGVAVGLCKDELWNFVKDISKFKERGDEYFNGVYHAALERRK